MKMASALSATAWLISSTSVLVTERIASMSLRSALPRIASVEDVFSLGDRSVDDTVPLPSGRQRPTGCPSKAGVMNWAMKDAAEAGSARS